MISRHDFTAQYTTANGFRYELTYTSPKTGKVWTMYTNYSELFDELRDDSTTNKRLNEIKWLIKNA